MEPKTRILSQRLAGIVAALRHGEMIFVGDAGGGTSSKGLIPLAADVEMLDLGVATGEPSFMGTVRAIIEVGDIEAAIVANGMLTDNPEAHAMLVQLLGEENVHAIQYMPGLYKVRDRCKAFVQTGDYAVHGNVALVGGYPSAAIDLEVLLTGEAPVID